MTRRFIATWFAVGASALLIGCGSEPTMEVVPASGVVSLDGKPIEGVSLTLIPEGSVKGRGGYGITDSEGRFALQTSPKLEGVSPGKYRVLFQKLTMPDGSPIPPDAMAADVGAVNALPDMYNSPEHSNMLAIIPTPDTGGMRFDLSSRARPRP